MLAELVRKAERGEARLEDGVTEARKRDLAAHLADLGDHLRAKGTGDKQRGQIVSRVRKVCDGCAFTFPQDIQSAAVEAYLLGRRQLRKKDGGFSTQTSNFYLAAARQFCRWMVRKKRLPEDPLADLAPLNADLDRRHLRRDLKPEELQRLFDTTLASAADYRGLSGADRHMLYHTACGTGFRSFALSTLTPESFDLDATPPAVTVAAAYTKN